MTPKQTAKQTAAKQKRAKAKAKTTTAEPTSFALEEWGPLSASVIWSLERDGYRTAGVDGWRSGMVPHYITTNPFIAHAYARVALAYLRDIEAAGLTEQPVTIVELGAGPGRFGYTMVRRLLELHAASRVRVPFRYVFTDFVESNIATWQSHPYLKPLVDSGVLDFARFDLTADTELTLQCSGDVLRPGDTAGPAMVIANYVFDSVPQDCFYIDGEMREFYCQATSTQAVPDLAAHDALEHVRLSFEMAPVPVDRYADPAARAVLSQYAGELGATTVLFPTAALGCLDRLQAIFGGKLLLLSGDKGFHRVDDMGNHESPDLVTHGSVFSLMVNFDAIGRWCGLRGGFAMHPTRRPASLSISACATGFGEESLPDTRLEYTDAIETLSPDDYFAVLTASLRDVERLDFAAALALLRLSGWDAEVFARVAGILTEGVRDAPRGVQDELAWSLHKVWETYFPIGERTLDVAALLSAAFYEMGFYRDAIEFLHFSLELYGPAVETLFNLALCHYAAGEIDTALSWAEETTRADSTFTPARNLRMRLDAESRRISSTRRASTRYDPVGRNS